MSPARFREHPVGARLPVARGADAAVVTKKGRDCECLAFESFEAEDATYLLQKEARRAGGGCYAEEVLQAPNQSSLRCIQRQISPARPVARAEQRARREDASPAASARLTPLTPAASPASTKPGRGRRVEPEELEAIRIGVVPQVAPHAVSRRLGGWRQGRGRADHRAAPAEGRQLTCGEDRVSRDAVADRECDVPGAVEPSPAVLRGCRRDCGRQEQAQREDLANYRASRELAACRSSSSLWIAWCR
jgi:hypothetical protein